MIAQTLITHFFIPFKWLSHRFSKRLCEFLPISDHPAPFFKPGVSGEIRITLVMIKTAGIRQGVMVRPQRVGYTSAWKKRLIVSALEQFTALLGPFLSPDLTRPWWMGLQSRAERLSWCRGLRPSVSDMTRSLWTVLQLKHDLRLIFWGLHQVTFTFYTAFPKASFSVCFDCSRKGL